MGFKSSVRLKGITVHCIGYGENSVGISLVVMMEKSRTPLAGSGGYLKTSVTFQNAFRSTFIQPENLPPKRTSRVYSLTASMFA